MSVKLFTPAGESTKIIEIESPLWPSIRSFNFVPDTHIPYRLSMIILLNETVCITLLDQELGPLPTMPSNVTTFIP